MGRLINMEVNGPEYRGQLRRNTHNKQRNYFLLGIYSSTRLSLFYKTNIEEL